MKSRASPECPLHVVSRPRIGCADLPLRV